MPARNRHSPSLIKRRLQRPSPSSSAAETPIGTVRRGNDKEYWVVHKTKSGTKRWVRASPVKSKSPKRASKRKSVKKSPKRASKRKSVKKSPKRASKRKSVKKSKKFPVYYSKDFVPRFDKYKKELKAYNASQKKELLKTAAIYNQLGLVRTLLNMGVKPSNRVINIKASEINHTPSQRAKAIYKLIKGLKQ